MTGSKVTDFVSANLGLTKSLIESLKDGVALFDKGKQVILINDAMMRITGLPQEGFYISEVTNLFRSKVNIEEELDKALQTAKETFIKDVSILEKYYYEMRIIPVVDDQEEVSGGAIILHDITYLKEIDKMKTEFISIASHQLRTPLTSIRWYTQMLEDESFGQLEGQQKEFVDEVYHGSIRMIELINALLNVSRLETGRIKIDPQPADLTKEIDRIIKETRNIAKDKGKKCEIEFKCEVQDLPLVPVDSLVFSQVVENFLSNAIRYSPADNGQIEVVLKEHDADNYEVSVKDNGIGVPEKMKDKLFTKFTRAENAKKMASEGTGLGLYIIKTLVETYGGKIWFESEEGKGSTFFVTVPKTGMKAKAGEKSLAVS